MTVYREYYGNSEWVYLTDREINEAIEHGMNMRAMSVLAGHRDRPGYHPDERLAQRVQCLGAVAERAMIVALGVNDKLKVGIFRAADLIGNVEVRLIGRDHWGLRIYPKDIKPETGRPRRVVGVVIKPGRERRCPYRLPGWFDAGDDLDAAWWMSPGEGQPMCAVPQKKLRPLSELRDLIRAEGFALSRL